MPKKIKQPRVMKTKEELIKEMRSSAKFQEKMKFTKEQFFPALIKASKNIEDAKMFLSSISSVLMEKFLQSMREKKMSELELVKGLDEKGENYAEIKAMLELFDDMTVFDAKDTIEGMKGEIQLFIDKEMEGRTLDTLQTKWLDED